VHSYSEPRARFNARASLSPDALRRPRGPVVPSNASERGEAAPERARSSGGPDQANLGLRPPRDDGKRPPGLPGGRLTFPAMLG